ncbi:MAG TPA: DUF4402 domain-containing protein [Azospirillaceae bacterium]|nr:DUF4402 domain-containing protein [Azospirillaceae bacterium]
MKLSTILKSAAATLVLAAVAGSANAATSNFTASATVVAPIAVTTGTNLSFGGIIASASAGTVVIDAAGARSTTGGATASGGTVSAASFNVTGAPSTAYNITLPASANISSGGDNMSVAFAAATHLTGGSTARTLTAGGTDTFNLGGTVSVGANQAAGSYSGTFTMTVNY